MKICQKCRKNKGTDQFSKDRHKSDGLCTQCKACKKAYVAEYYIKNREDIINNVKKYAEENAIIISTRNAISYRKNKDTFKERAKKIRNKNKKNNLEKESLGIENTIFIKRCWSCKSNKNSNEFYSDVSNSDGFSGVCMDCSKSRGIAWAKANPDKCNKNSKKHRQKYPDKHNARQKKREMKKKQRLPPWITKEQLLEMQEFYTLAKELQWLSGEKLEVDHIVPLQGKNVSGLHVPWNLQILPSSMNRSKSNKF